MPDTRSTNSRKLFYKYIQEEASLQATLRIPVYLYNKSLTALIHLHLKGNDLLHDLSKFKKLLKMTNTIII